MFTGLIETRGTITVTEPHGDGLRLRIHAPKILDDVAIGDSIAINGVCLTVTGHNGESFATDVMYETLRASALRTLTDSLPAEVNCERAALASSRLGGHIVQGHVDAMATVLSITPGDKWRVIRFELPKDCAPLLVHKGSITIDGVSLTISGISEVTDSEQWFEVSLIPETLTATTLGALREGESVNIETDIIARHVARLSAWAHRNEGALA